MGHVERTVEMRNTYVIFVGKYRGIKPFRGYIRTQEDNIKMNVKERGRI
jgi:hypothetical protein